MPENSEELKPSDKVYLEMKKKCILMDVNDHLYGYINLPTLIYYVIKDIFEIKKMHKEVHNNTTAVVKKGGI